MSPSDTLSPDALVTRIAALQSTGTDTYAAGLFPTQRTHPFFRRSVEDNTVFFTALILYVLQEVRDDLSPESRQRADAIIRAGRHTYPRYLNNQGYPLYNFWQIHPREQFFPNGRFCSRFRHFRLPEDVDVTSFVYLTQPHSEDDVHWLKQRMAVDTNRNRRQVRTTLPKYSHLRAYSTWLGDANMPIDFDVCVLCNLLLFVFKYGLPLNVHDHDSIRLIRGAVEAGDYVTHPFVLAPWYGHSGTILYHVARLVGTYDVPGLNGCRALLIDGLHQQLGHAASLLERVVLSTSLMRLGEPPAVTALPTDIETMEAEAWRYRFVRGDLITALGNHLLGRLATYDVFHFAYRCTAHGLALVLEHEALRQRRC